MVPARDQFVIHNSFLPAAGFAAFCPCHQVEGVLKGYLAGAYLYEDTSALVVF